MSGLGWTRAIALGVVTAIGVGINLGNIIPTLERNYASATALADASTLVRAEIPGDSAVFTADENMANYLDAWGAYKIFNCNLFSTASYDNWRHLVDDPERQDEPEGRQRTRMRQYLEMISRRDSQGHRL